MKKIYAEIGFDNKGFLSTEIEEKENRINKFILPIVKNRNFFSEIFVFANKSGRKRGNIRVLDYKKIQRFYIRPWIFRKVFILSTNAGFSAKNKDKNRLKIFFVIQKKSKPLLLSRGRHNEGDVFFPAAENLSEDFLCPKIPDFLVSKTSNKPSPSEISNF